MQRPMLRVVVLNGAFRSRYFGEVGGRGHSRQRIRLPGASGMSRSRGTKKLRSVPLRDEMVNLMSFPLTFSSKMIPR